MDSAALIYEFGKFDSSIGTFIMVHNCIGMAVIDMLGSEEQRARILPDALQFKKILAFGLTAPDYGSDASSLKTSARKVEGGYLVKGQKRWIGNGTFADYIIVWARNESEDGKV